jgi:tetratricopeptide (TPR) repeat protein
VIVPRRSPRTPVACVPGSPGRAAERLRAALAAEDFALAADAAMEIGPPARGRLPESHRPAFDAACDAFALFESGHDEAAREKLQAVGLSSPFLDWKLLLRGLIAHAAGDPSRALDNWSRLAPGRLPARLIAPLRFALDPPFRTAQPPGMQAQLQSKGDRLIGGLAPRLRELQRLLARPRLDNAFRQAESILPELKRDLPEAVGRIADCFRAAIVGHGEPADIDRYRRLFGAPPDDPTLARLEALAAEERHAWSASHTLWQRFEATVIDCPAWPAADRDRVRAHVWCRMGRNADNAAKDGRRLQPNAETCYRRAAELAPGFLEPHEQLFKMLRHRNRLAPALAAGKRLVKQFPDHGPALEAMADLCQTRGHAAEALEYARRALAANPLDRRLRGKLAEIHRVRARALAAMADYAGAEAELAESFTLSDRRAEIGPLALSAVIAYKSGNAATAEERVRRATAIGPTAAYPLAAEAVRFTLPKPLKRRFEAEFATVLAAPATGPAAVNLAAAFLDQTRHGAYVGQKGHERKVRTYIEAALKREPAEADLVRLCHRLRDLDWLRLLKKSAAYGQTRFTRNPFFPFFEAAAQLPPADRLFGRAAWKVEPLLEKARRLAENYPPDDELRRMLEELDEVRRVLAVPAPFAHVFNQLFDAFDEDP